MQSRTCIYVFKLILIVCHHYTATLEMDYLQLALQLLEHWELMVGCLITLIIFLVILS